MREVVVEHVGGVTRTIQVGRKKKQKKKRKRTDSFKDIICSPRILVRATDDWYTPDYSDTKCWKTHKKGEPKPKKHWQRHADRKPSRRRNRWGRVRKHIYPSPRILNELGRCIHPNVGGW